MALSRTNPAVAVRIPGGPTDAAIRVTEVVRQTWGFDELRPLQAESIAATLAGRDSLTVMPTGGGKSLCYQVPPLVTGRLTLVVSPLIALMRDQVAALRLAGVAAAGAHSHASAREKGEARELAESGELRLLFVAPERLLHADFLSWVCRLNVGAVAIDEAHCISQWGHDFRPEYRRLAEVREALPGVPIAAYTATATPRVREDVVAQLRLRDAAVLVGVFDRPNLTYRVLPRVDLLGQVIEALKRHPDRAAIVYCISRKDTESLAGALKASGVDAAAYHAGMEAAPRTKISEDFRAERLNVVVATVAFGMGIDRGDVRCVVHAALPKSLEHYQQETGRAGRDGLPAECLLLYSGGDVARWRQVMERGAEEQNAAPEALAHQLGLVEEMRRFATSTRCRHAAISAYFGQAYPRADCGACDSCLREHVAIADAQDTARKILSCVARCNQSFGAVHIADVLMGKPTPKVVERGHDRLSTFGLLRHLRKEQVVNYIGQLVDAGDLSRDGGEYPVIRLTGKSAEVLRNARQAVLVEPKAQIGKRRGKAPSSTHKAQRRGAGADAEDSPLTPAEERLFEELRAVRRRLAGARNVPPFMILGDAALAEICRVRPGSLGTLINVRGIGTRKVQDFGAELVEAVVRHSRDVGLPLDVRQGSRSRSLRPMATGAPAHAEALHLANEVPGLTMGASLAAPLFRRGDSVEQVMAALGRARGTVEGYLDEFVRLERPEVIDPWVDAPTRERIYAAADGRADRRLKPVFDALGGSVPYYQIRAALAWREGRRGS